MNKNKVFGFKVIENVRCNDTDTLQTAITNKISRIINAELCNDDGISVNYKQKHGVATYG
ncbi:MAG: hypothetical protein FWG45_00995 [Oscillospiraceae bacterium]|nr:hypothetical protein [Oscillospiraceae bacterium]